MAIITSLICLLFIFISVLLEKRIYSPLILFNAWWGITIFISHLGFFGIFVPNETTYFCMLVAILAFNFPFIFLLKESKFKQEKSEMLNTDLVDSKSFIVRLLLFLQGTVIFILVIRSYKAMQLLMAGLGFSAIRYNYFKQETIMSGYDHFINNIFVMPILTFSIIFISLQFFQKKYNKPLMFLTIISIILFVFSSGGRGIVITLGIVFITSYYINGRNIRKIEFSKKLLIQIIALGVFLSLVYISLQRLETGGGLKGVIETVVVYFTAPYIYYENMIPNVINDHILLYGKGFFGGIIDLFIFVLRFLGLDISPISAYISTYNQMYIVVSNDGSIYNAFPTMLYTFYYDFGYVGIILGSLMFGFLSFIFYKKMITSDNFGYKGIYIMVVLMIYESPMRWIGTSAHVWIVILMFLFLLYWSKNKRNVNKN